MLSRPALVLALVLASGCRSKPAGPRDKPDPEAARELASLKKHIADFEHRLAAIRRAVPEAAHVEDQPCPEEALETKLHGKPGSLLLAEYEYLGRYAGDDHEKDRGRWNLLTTAALRVVPPLSDVAGTAQATDALWNIKKVQRDYDYMGVLRSSRRELPRMDGQRFHPGVLEGGLFVFDLTSGKLLCRARIDAHSSEQVAGTQGQDRARALWNDFSMQLGQELDRALSRVTKQLEIDRG